MNNEIPEVAVVTASDYKYKSFIAPVADAEECVAQMESPKIQAIMKQAFYVLDQHALGHVAAVERRHQRREAAQQDGERAEAEHQYKDGEHVGAGAV